MTRCVPITALAALGATALAAQPPAGREARIAAVERGLLPAVRVRDQERRFELAPRMEHYRVPGVSVAVMMGSRLDWAKGYGVLQAGEPARVDAETRFQAASISKPVAALAALGYVAEGTLALDAPVNRSLESWKLPDNEHTVEHPVTLRGLLSHTAGLDVHGFPGYGPSESLPSLRDVLDGTALANTPPIRAVRTPGEGFVYSGGGYVLLQQLLVDVAERPFDALVYERVLGPLGMTHSSFAQPPPPAIADKAARGHDVAGDVVVGGWNTYPELAAAGLWTTPSDLVRFVQELQWSLAGRSEELIPRELAREMTAPQNGGPFGLGLALDGEGAAARFGHGGANNGYRAELVGYLEGGHGAVVMTNSDSGGELAREILAAIAAVYGWPGYLPEEKVIVRLGEAVLERYAGVYELGPHRRMQVRRVGDHLEALQPGSAPLALWPESETAFFALDTALEARFEVEGGAVLGVHLRRDGWELPARRVE